MATPQTSSKQLLYVRQILNEWHEGIHTDEDALAMIDETITEREHAMTTRPSLSPKYDSFEHSALHFLCNAGWGNESDGDANDYGSFFTRISLGWEDVKPSNAEFTSLLEQWPDHVDVPIPMDVFRIQLTGHWLVAEDSQGFVHVRRFGTESALKWRFDQFAAHDANWNG